MNDTLVCRIFAYHKLQNRNTNRKEANKDFDIMY